MDMNFTGKVVLVTGGARGIGRAIAQGFAQRGATTLITYAQSAAKAEEFVKELTGAGHKAHCYKVDVANTEEMADFIDKTSKEMGGIDVLVNNAGITKDGLVMMMSKEDWCDVVNTNLTGIYNAIKPISRIMMKKKGGAIINISSVVASKPNRGQVNYVATKGGVEALTRGLAAELGVKGIRVNCVAPGMIETDMTQMIRDHAGDQITERITLRRYGKPEEIANAVIFLASDMASYITGEVLHVDGGF